MPSQWRGRASSPALALAVVVAVWGTVQAAGAPDEQEVTAGELVWSENGDLQLPQSFTASLAETSGPIRLAIRCGGSSWNVEFRAATSVPSVHWDDFSDVLGRPLGECSIEVAGDKETAVRVEVRPPAPWDGGSEIRADQLESRLLPPFVQAGQFEVLVWDASSGQWRIAERSTTAGVRWVCLRDPVSRLRGPRAAVTIVAPERRGMVGWGLLAAAVALSGLFSGILLARNGRELKRIAEAVKELSRAVGIVQASIDSLRVSRSVRVALPASELDHSRRQAGPEDTTGGGDSAKATEAEEFLRRRVDSPGAASGAERREFPETPAIRIGGPELANRPWNPATYREPGALERLRLAYAERWLHSSAKREARVESLRRFLSEDAQRLGVSQPSLTLVAVDDRSYLLARGQADLALVLPLFMEKGRVNPFYEFERASLAGRLGLEISEIVMPCLVRVDASGTLRTEDKGVWR